MAAEVFIHKMSDHMETAKILKWLVDEGEHVEKYQILLEVETDKAVAELESPATGVVKNIRAGVVEGVEIPVGEVIAFITDPDENVPVLPPFTESGEEPASHSVVSQQASAETAPPDKGKSGAVRATPVARRVAKELGIDLSQVIGSGPGGRIREKDVQAFVENAASTPTVSKSLDEFELTELTSYQSLTGQRMLESVQTAPQFALNLAIDMTNVLWLREALMEQILAETGSRLSITAIMVKITAEVLKLVPQANATFEKGRIKLYKLLNIGLAVGSEMGLVVPVIKDADKKSLPEIVREINVFQDKAKAMRFKPDDLKGGTFTLSNLGMYGVDQFNAIINPPQSAILAVGRINRTPIALEDDTVVVRPMTNFTLTVDHRCIDGVQGARFLDQFKEKLENPYFLLKS
jgi:pyruvate dehydrogenase E2 component (dihydrolipoamide acetyltransferase)